MKIPSHETKATPENLLELAAMCKGRTGGKDAESHLSMEGWFPDTVTLCTTRLCDVANLVERAGSAILSWRMSLDGEMATVTVYKRHPKTKKKVFRGFPMCFAPVDVESAPWGGPSEVSTNTTTADE